jgi:hypothetical protein
VFGIVYEAPDGVTGVHSLCAGRTPALARAHDRRAIRIAEPGRAAGKRAGHSAFGRRRFDHHECRPGNRVLDARGVMLAQALPGRDHPRFDISPAADGQICV